MVRRRPPDLRRRGPQREPKRRFIIFCEGEKTEPTYFAAVGRTCADALIAVTTVRAVGVPITIAQSAVAEMRRRRARNSFEERDEVWAVFDRDEHPRYAEAVGLCENVGVGVGRSDPCFELWLILHERDFDKPDDSHAAQAHLHELRPEYDPDRRKTPDCAELMARVEQAEARAEVQLVRRENEGRPHGRPSTTVWRLTRVIRLAAERSRRVP
jgi:RloB-like protein